MKLFSEKTMETLKQNTGFNQSSEHELLLINGGLGCSTGSEQHPVTDGSQPPYNMTANIAGMLGNIISIYFGRYNLSCTLW